MTSKAKAKSTSTTVRHGNTSVTTSHHAGETTTSRSVRHGDHRTTVTTVKRGGKVISTTKRTAVIAKYKPKPKAKTKAKTKAKKRGATGTCLDGYWVTGGNDRLETCVPVAVANSLLITTGYRVPDWQILALAGERSIEDVLAELGFPFREAEGVADGVILGVAGGHTVTALDGGAVSYGGHVDLAPYVIEEMWEVDWRCSDYVSATRVD